jgi:hypothetical protein
VFVGALLAAPGLPKKFAGHITKNFMLLTLMTAATSMTFLVSAVLAAKRAHAGPAGYVLAFLVGLTLASCNAWALYEAGDILARRTRSCPESQQDRTGRAFCFLLLLWLPATAFLGDWLAITTLRFLG